MKVHHDKPYVETPVTPGVMSGLPSDKMWTGPPCGPGLHVDRADKLLSDTTASPLSRRTASPKPTTNTTMEGDMLDTDDTPTIPRDPSYSGVESSTVSKTVATILTMTSGMADVQTMRRTIEFVGGAPVGINLYMREVGRVHNGSQAGRKGVKPGWVIINVKEEPVTGATVEDVIRAESQQADNSYTITFQAPLNEELPPLPHLRDDELPDALPDVPSTEVCFTSHNHGLVINEHTGVVKQVVKNSEAHTSGIKPGWILTHIGDRRVKADEILKFLRRLAAPRRGGTWTARFIIAEEVSNLWWVCTNKSMHPQDVEGPSQCVGPVTVPRLREMLKNGDIANDTLVLDNVVYNEWTMLSLAYNLFHELSHSLHRARYLDEPDSCCNLCSVM